jgi:hypothetical protein
VPEETQQNPLAAALMSVLVTAVRPLILAVLDEQGLLGASGRINDLESRMTDVENEAFGQLGTLIGVVVAEVTSLRESDVAKTQALVNAAATIESLQSLLQGAEADKAQAVLDAVNAAAALDSQADTTRVLSYVDQLKAAVPATQTVPDVPVPPAGEPAEVPADDGTGAAPVEVPEVDPTPTPEPDMDIPVADDSGAAEPATGEGDEIV